MAPMDAKIKQRKVINRRKPVRPTELARPEEVKLIIESAVLLEIKQERK